MAGRKLFTNHSSTSLGVTLAIRASADPRNQAGTKDFVLGANQSQWQDYGDNVNIYLNGITISAQVNGASERQHFVIVRGSPLDNQLNMHNGVDFLFQNGSFTMSTRQVS